MTGFRDLSGNGIGVEVLPPMVSVMPAGADTTVPGKMTSMRAKGAGNIILRPPGGLSDITLAVVDGEYVPVNPGTIIRSTGTTVTALVAMQGRSML
jgi:hypothetical protein